MKSLQIFFLSSLFTTQAFAWDDIGHRVVGAIAARHLSAKAEDKVSSILNGESLAEASTWPDEIKSNPRYDFAKAWHYVEIPIGKEYDAAKKSPNGDILDALQRMERILRGQEQPYKVEGVQIGKKEALRFLIHLAGDIHQPLHIGNGKDKGGNDCRVKWFGEFRRGNAIWNLHKVWDGGLIDSLHLSYSELTDFIDRDISKSEITSLQKASYLDWANESKALRSKAYPTFEADPDYCKKDWPSEKFKRGKGPKLPDLGYPYKAEFVSLVKERLLKAGIRLAGVLNSIYK